MTLRNPIITTLALIASLNVFSQVLGPAPTKYLKEQHETYKPSSSKKLHRANNQNCNRQEVIDDYLINYLGSSVDEAELSWTGNQENCNAGEVSLIAKNKVINRINYFRRLVGLSDNITLTTEKDHLIQEAALIMSAQNNLSHAPPTDWACWSQNGSDGAAISNLALGTHSTDAINLYINDYGSGNTAVGHRRWILYSRATEFGTASATNRNSHSLFVFGTTTTPTELPEFIAYPSEGFFPRSLLYPRWSFGIPGADFSNVSIEVKNELNEDLNITIHPYKLNRGDNTIAWEMPTESVSFTTDKDRIYTVTISGIENAQETSYTYQVVAIKESTPTTAIIPTHPTCEDNGQAIIDLNVGSLNTVWDNSQQGDTLKNVTLGKYTAYTFDKIGCPVDTTEVILTDNSDNAITPGTISSTIKNCNDTLSLNLSTADNSFKTPDQTIAWWITKNNPITTQISDQVSLNEKIDQALINPANITANDNSFIYNSTTLDELSTELVCGDNLDPESNYFATPVVAYDYIPAPTMYSNSTTEINDVSEQGEDGVTILPIEVSQLPTTANLSQVCLDVDFTNNSLLGDLTFQLKSPSGSIIYIAANIPLFDTYRKGGLSGCFTNNETAYELSEGCNGTCYSGDLASIGLLSTFDTENPVGTWELIITDNGNRGFSPSFISVNLVFDEPSFPITFPKIDYTKCVFGTPQEFSCNSSFPTITGEETMCSNNKTELDAGANFNSYLWNTGETTQSIIPEESGTYTVDLTFGDCSYNEISFQTEIVSPPDLSIIQSFVNNDTEEIMLSGEGQSGVTYLWSTGETTKDIIISDRETHSLEVTDRFGCTNTDSLEVGSLIGLADFMNNKIMIFPNPTTDDIHIQFDEISDFTVQLTNIEGVVLKEFEQNNTINSLDIDLSNNNSGVYILKFISEDNVILKSIIKR